MLSLQQTDQKKFFRYRLISLPLPFLSSVSSAALPCRRHQYVLWQSVVYFVWGINKNVLVQMMNGNKINTPLKLQVHSVEKKRRRRNMGYYPDKAKGNRICA